MGSARGTAAPEHAAYEVVLHNILLPKVGKNTDLMGGLLDG